MRLPHIESILALRAKLSSLSILTRSTDHPSGLTIAMDFAVPAIWRYANSIIEVAEFTPAATGAVGGAELRDTLY
jgi:hypothetical protein